MLLVFQPMSHTFMPSVIHLYVNSNCVHFLFEKWSAQFAVI